MECLFIYLDEFHPQKVFKMNEKTVKWIQYSYTKKKEFFLAFKK